MRTKALLLAGFTIGLAACGGNAERQPRPVAELRYPMTKIKGHRVEEHLGANIILQEKALPPTLLVDIENAGDSGDVRIRVEQGSRHWESRTHFGERERRTIRIDLPGAENGVISVRAEAVQPPAPAADAP